MDGPPTDDKAAISFGMCKPCSEKVMQEWRQTMEGQIVEWYRVVSLVDDERKPRRYHYFRAENIESALEIMATQRVRDGAHAVLLFTDEWKLIFAEPGLDNTEGITIRGVVL